MRMRWCDLLFAHWPVDPAVLRPLIPKQLELDLFGGCAYVGVVPFKMEGVRPRRVPALPGLHAFPELNLRTYVTAGGKPGVWFFSLDAGQKLAVRVARRFFHLPYFDAKFGIETLADGGLKYAAVRTHRGNSGASFQASYRPIGPVYESSPGSLDSWLTDRYCLYSADAAGMVYRGEISHAPWPLQPAEAEVQRNTLGDWLGIEMPGPPQTLHFAESLAVEAWFVVALDSDTRMIELHVRLLNEGTDVARPTRALVLGNGLFKLLPAPGYDPGDEDWELAPGAIVRSEPRKGDKGDFLLAVKL